MVQPLFNTHTHSLTHTHTHTHTLTLTLSLSLAHTLNHSLTHTLCMQMYAYVCAYTCMTCAATHGRPLLSHSATTLIQRIIHLLPRPFLLLQSLHLLAPSFASSKLVISRNVSARGGLQRYRQILLTSRPSVPLRCEASRSHITH